MSALSRELLESNGIFGEEGHVVCSADPGGTLVLTLFDDTEAVCEYELTREAAMELAGIITGLVGRE